MAATAVRVPHNFIRLSRDHREDLRVWDMFFEQYNGRSFWLGPVVQAAELDLFTDAAGSMGYAAYFNGGGRRSYWGPISFGT